MGSSGAFPTLRACPKFVGAVAVPRRRGGRCAAGQESASKIGGRMVALRRPDELPPPPDDGLPTRAIKPHTHDKLHFWGCYLEAASTATKRQFAGARVCADL